MNIVKSFNSILARDLKLAFRNRRELINPMLFFVIIVILFPLAIGPYANKLQSIAAGVIWVAALLAVFMNVNNMFRSDWEDGSLEQLVLSEVPTFILILSKILAYFIITCLPLIIVAPLLASSLYMPDEAIIPLIITLLLGTPTLLFIGSVASALTVGLRQGGILLALLIIPLYIPVLIFATSVIENAIAGFPVDSQLYMLGAMLVASATLCPIAAAFSLRVSMS